MTANPPFFHNPIPPRLDPGIAWVFLDLDGTLWDHETASLDALKRLCAEFDLPPDSFIPRFERANDTAWHQLAEGQTNRDRMRVERFEWTLADVAPHRASRGLAEALGRRYLEIYLEDPNRYWIEGGRDLLEAVGRTGRRAALLTNGFSDTQLRKVEEAGEAGVLDFIWGPEEARCLKPRIEFFTTALARAGCAPHEALMIGDSLSADVLAPLAVGIRSWWFNRKRAPLPGQSGSDGTHRTYGTDPTHPTSLTGLTSPTSPTPSPHPPNPPEPQPAFPIFTRLAEILPLFRG